MKLLVLLVSSLLLALPACDCCKRQERCTTTCGARTTLCTTPCPETCSEEECVVTTRGEPACREIEVEVPYQEVTVSETSAPRTRQESYQDRYEMATDDTPSPNYNDEYNDETDMSPVSPSDRVVDIDEEDDNTSYQK